MKTCKRCQQPGRFRPNRRTCMDCEATAQANRRAIDPDKARRISRDAWRRRFERDPEAVRAGNNRRAAAYHQRHKARLARERKIREASPEWQARYGGLNRVRAAVSNAIKAGKLIRPEACSRCGVRCKPEAAHESYDEPLKVLWLCRSCHRRWDNTSPKTRRVG